MCPGCARWEQRPRLLPADEGDAHPAEDSAGLPGPAGGGWLQHPSCGVHHHKGQAPLCPPPSPVGHSPHREAGHQLCPEGQAPGQVGSEEACSQPQHLKRGQLLAVNPKLLEPAFFQLQMQGQPSSGLMRVRWAGRNPACSLFFPLYPV